MQQIGVNLYFVVNTKEIIGDFIPDALDDKDIGVNFYQSEDTTSYDSFVKFHEIKAKSLPGDTGVLPEKEDKKDDLKVSITDNFTSVIITDDMQVVSDFSKESFKHLKVVYFHDIKNGFLKEDENKLPDTLYDWWYVSSNDKLSVKVKRMLYNIKKEYDAWLYKNYLETTINSIPELIWYKDIKGAHEKVNDKFCEVVHKTKEQVEGRGHYYIWDISMEEYATGEYICMESEEEVMKKKKTCIFEEPVKTSEGMKLFVTYKSPILDINGDVIGTVGVAHDMTNFTDTDSKLNMLIENLPYPLMICDQNMRAVRFNSSFKKYFGFTDKDIKNFVYSDWKKRVFTPEDVQRSAEKGISTSQNMIFKKYGENYYFKLIERKILDYFGNLSGYYCIFRNQTRERVNADKVLEMANVDYLTGLYNRRLFYDYLHEHEKELITIVYMDLNNFKYINDKYGHSEGDKTLKKSAETIKRLFGSSLVARIGGDEFAAVLLGKHDDILLAQKIERLKNEISSICDNEDIHFGISVGISTSEDGNISVEEMIRKSDTNMYADKKEYKKALQKGR